MRDMNRREFVGSSLAALGAAAIVGTGSAAEAPKPKLPRVRWGRHEISRLCVGHNPLKGQSHFSAELDKEMREWFGPDNVHGKELLRRCEEMGINACQLGAPPMEALLRAHYADGGTIQWIPTFYSPPGKGKEELQRILAMRPKPIGFQYYGGTTDTLMLANKLDSARDDLKMLRDTGLLVGLCTHNHEVVDYAESKSWDLDFYQTCFYRVSSSLHERGSEIYREEARLSMVKTIKQCSKPCLAFKVLGANRHCRTPETVFAALKFAFDNIKPTDCVLLGMWQRHKDQVAENVASAQKILGIA